MFADPLTADVARFCRGADDAGVQDAATGALGGLVDSNFRPCPPFMPFSEPHAAATGNLLPPSTAVLPSPGTIAAPAAALGAGADSSTDWGGAAVPKRQRSSGAKATNAENARAKRLRVKEQQSANDEELAALRLLCSKQAEELQQLPPDSRARCAEIAQARAERQARGAQETSARAQAANSNLVDEVHKWRSVAAAAGAEAKQARREAREARAKLEQVECDHLVHLGEAVAVAVHGAEKESRQTSIAVDSALAVAQDAASCAKVRAARAEARARDAAASATAAATAAHIQNRKLKRELRDAKLQLRSDAAHAHLGRERAEQGAISRFMLSMEAGGADEFGASASSSCSRDTAAGSSSSCDDDGDTGCTGRARQHRVSAAPPTALRNAAKEKGMKLATSGISYGQAKTLASMDSSIANTCGTDIKRHLQRCSCDARAIGLMLHGIDLMAAEKRLSIKGDGFSDHDVQSGVKEYFTETHTLLMARGVTLELPLDGLLLSEGLTAKAEADLCKRSIAFLKRVMGVLLAAYTKMHGDALPPWFEIGRIDMAAFSHVGADGANAAQAWARLIRDEIQSATIARIGAEVWAALDPIAQQREIFVLVSKCATHGGSLGFNWARKAMAKLTDALGAAAVESVRDGGHASDHFAHSMNLAQALWTGNKLIGSRTGYDHGKAFYILGVAKGQEYSDTEWIHWPRLNGSRMLGSLRMTPPFLRNRSIVSKALERLFFHPTLSKVVSSFWSQMHSPLLNLEARVQEAILAGLAEPAQVLLGQSAFGGAVADGDGGDGGDSGGRCDSEWQSMLSTAFAHNAAAKSAADAAGAAVAKQASTNAKGPRDQLFVVPLLSACATPAKTLVALKQALAPFVEWHVAHGAQHSVASYRAAVGAADRAAAAEALRLSTPAGAAAALAVCGDTGAAVLLVDAGEFDEPGAGGCGMWQLVDIIAGLVRACRATADDPDSLFDGRRASARLSPFLPAYATAALKEWEGAVYKRPGRNACGDIVNPSSRAAADAWRAETLDICAELEADGTRDKYVEAGCTACADEFERYFKSALGGELGAGNRCSWQGDKLRGAALNTNGVESCNGASKYVRARLVTGSHNRIVASMLARRAGMWERWDLLDDKMKGAAHAALPSLRPIVKEFTDQCFALNEAAELDRKQRQQKAAVQAAAKKYALALALHDMELWRAGSFKKRLGAFRFKYEKTIALEQQLDIITTGYGYSDCAFKHKKADAYCTHCGTDLSTCTKFEHLEEHVKSAVRYVGKPGRGKPGAAPPPVLCVKEKNFAPVLDDDQSKNPLHAALAQLGEEAKRIAPRLGITVCPQIAEGTPAPTLGAGLVGLVIEYVFRIAEPRARKKKSQLYTYQGRIESVQVVSAGTGKEHAIAACVWPTTLVDGVFKEQEEREACMLFAKHYASRKENGWVVYQGKPDEGGGADVVDLTEDNLVTKMDVAHIEASMLCAAAAMG